jgi:RNA polymerase sigma-70 factor (ECF subfamily)
VNCAAYSVEELIQACVETGDADAWEEFIHRFHAVIAATVIRTVRRFGEISPALIDDLIQDTYLKICANRRRVLREFKAERPESIFGLLKTIAFSVTMDYFRGKPWKARTLEDPLEDASPASMPSPDRKILLRQIDEFLAATTDPETRQRDRRIFWLHYRHGMTAREIAAIPEIGLTQKGVGSTIQRLTARVCAWLFEERQKRESPAKEPKGKFLATSL